MIAILKTGISSCYSTLRYLYQNFNESISSVQGGTIDSNGYSEIVVCTYTGRIFGLTTRCPNKTLNDSIMNQGFLRDSNVRIDKLKYDQKSEIFDFFNFFFEFE